MGEKPIMELVRKLKQQQPILDIPQLAYLTKEVLPQEGDITLFTHEEMSERQEETGSNFRHIEEESNKYAASRIFAGRRQANCRCQPALCALDGSGTRPFFRPALHASPASQI